MVNYTITKNDKGYTIQFTVTESDGSTARDLTDYTVTLQMWSIYAPGTDVINAECTKSEPQTSGICTYTLLAVDTDVEGTYEARLILTKTGVIEGVLEFFITIPGGGYCSLAQVKSEMQNFGDTPDDSYDAILQSLIETAKEYIDDYCQRTFTVVEDTIKYYDGKAKVVFVDDLLSVDSFKLDEDGDGTYETDLTENTDYILYPENTTPKMWVELSSHSSRTISDFADGIKRGIKITGTWGYATTIPKVVNRASVIQVIRWYNRIQGGYSTVIGSPEVGTVEVYQGLDSSIKAMLSPLVKRAL